MGRGEYIPDAGETPATSLKKVCWIAGVGIFGYGSVS